MKLTIERHDDGDISHFNKDDDTNLTEWVDFHPEIVEQIKNAKEGAESLSFIKKRLEDAKKHLEMLGYEDVRDVVLASREMSVSEWKQRRLAI